MDLKFFFKNLAGGLIKNRSTVSIMNTIPKNVIIPDNTIGSNTFSNLLFHPMS